MFDNNKRIIITYIILMTLIFLCTCLSVNLAVQNYLKYIFLILLYGSIGYIFLILSSIWYKSEFRTNIILKRKIKKVNLYIKFTIEILKSYIDNPTPTYKKYNKTRKKVNKLLSKKNINRTFQPVFNEDEKVLNVINLFDKISGNNLSKPYKQYKEVFKSQNGLRPLSKFHKQISNEILVSEIKNHMILLKGTIDNNNDEIELLNNYCPNNLYKKYNLFQTIQKELIIKCVFTTFLLVILVYGNLSYLRNGYSNAIVLYNNKNYEQSIRIFENLRFYADAEERAKAYAYEYANICYDREQYSLALYYYNHAWGYEDSVTKAINLSNKFNRLFSTSGSHTVVVKKDGTVMATGKNEDGECNCDDWKNIIAVSTGDLSFSTYTVGLKSDGTVVTTEKSSIFDSISYWKDIIAITTSRYNITGLDRNGNVSTSGGYADGQHAANGWKNMIAISSDYINIMGITHDGKCLYTDGGISAGQFYTTETSVENWEDIVAVTTTYYNIIGFKKDGTIIVVGEEDAISDSYMTFWKAPFEESAICCILDGGYLLDKNGNICAADGTPTGFGKLELSKTMIEFPAININDEKK